MLDQSLPGFERALQNCIEKNKLFAAFPWSPAVQDLCRMHRKRIESLVKAAADLKTCLDEIAARGCFRLPGIGPLFCGTKARLKEEDEVYKKVFRYSFIEALKEIYPGKKPEELIDQLATTDIERIKAKLTEEALIMSCYKGIPDLVGGRVCIPLLGLSTEAIVSLKKALNEKGYQPNPNTDFKDNNYLVNRSRGYYAYHFYVEPPPSPTDDPESRQAITAEIQVVTLLCNAWTHLTHGLSYKPDEAIYLQALRGHVIDDMASIYDVIHGVDEMATTMLQRISPGARVANP